MSNLKAKNIFKEKILAGEKTIGTFCELMSENVVEALGYAGLDYKE
jgi:2-keto-3-deoxy-L-rhamnonate aldolase RhmA